ncbi:MAG: ATP-binding protein, partial [Firmicutes bacterium]|nr:ATP-binding protein [Bacillota bacterium]
MLSKIKSYGLKGLEGFLVEVEVDLRQGLPVFDIVGLADTSVKEARERVKSAIKNSGLGFPILRVIVNLAPADTKKVGSVYDAAVAVGILKSCDVIPKHSADNFVILGELSLDGSLREIKGILPMLISAVQSGYKNFIVPYNNVREASYIEGANVFGVKNLRELTDFLNLDLHIAPAEKRVWDSASLKPTHLDFANVYGQTSAKRALEIAAAGGHNVMLLGPPGTGKTLLAKSFPSILPPLTFEEALEVTKIHSVAGILDKSAGIVRERPYRSPHHTTTAVTLTGGGRTA